MTASAKELIHNFETTIANIGGDNDTSYDSAYQPIACPVWGNGFQARQARAGDLKVVYSYNIGGVYFRYVGQNIGEASVEKKLHMSWNVARLNRDDIVPTFAELETAAEHAVRPDYIEQVDYFLEHLRCSAKRPAFPVEVGAQTETLDPILGELREFRAKPSVRSAAYCEDDEELELLIASTVRDGFTEREIEPEGRAVYANLTRRGHERLRGLDQVSLHEQAFVAMWFHESMTSAYRDAIRGAIEAAGYTAFRIDQDNQSGDQITNEIIAQIRRSRFLVADMTQGDSGARGGVYFEAGFAQGLGLPVFFTVRNDCVETLHFDTRQYPHVIWDPSDMESFKSDLEGAIVARIGVGPVV